MIFSAGNPALGTPLKTAKLLSHVPAERVNQTDGSVPEPGDIVVLDHGFNFHDGKPGGLVVCLHPNGTLKYEIEVYESDLEILMDDGSRT